MGGVDMAMAQAPVISDVSEVVPMEVGDSIEEIAINDLITVSTGPNLNTNFAIKGAAGVGVTGAMGAVDRLTYEILLSLEERKTLVVWMFDQSASLLPQRKEIHDRFDRIYEELGVIEAAGHKNFAQHGNEPLLSSVIAFGKNVTMRTKAPTNDLAEIKAAVAGIEQDDSGVEMVFSGLYMAAEKYKSFRIPSEAGGQPNRNVLLVVFTDEAGDDKDGLEHTIKICQRYAMPVYVVGVPALFGRRESLVKWVDPDPTYDQTPQWGKVSQGPESFLPERLCLAFSGYDEDEEPIDSGFGPFHLTRLCYETGGIYFAVHPNRTVGGAVSKEQTAAFSAHIRHFFDPRVMRRYKPDYVTSEEYGRRLQAFPSRYALVKAAELSWQAPMIEPRKKFVRKNEDAIRKEFNEAVDRDAEGAAPDRWGLSRRWRRAEPARERNRCGVGRRDTIWRWAGPGRQGASRWLPDPAGSGGERTGIQRSQEQPFRNPSGGRDRGRPAVGRNGPEKSRLYLNRVIEDHPDTPWALLARAELDEPLGWYWREWFVDMTPPPRVVIAVIGRGGGNGGRGGGWGDGRGVDGAATTARRVRLPLPQTERKPPRL